MAAGLARVAAGVGIGLMVAGAAAGAGGWGVVTFGPLPDYAVAGTPMTLSFSLRQHGVTLVPGLKGAIEAREDATGAVVRAPSTETRTGTYEATLTLPRAGLWTVEAAPREPGRFLFGLQSRPIPMPVVAPGETPPDVTDRERGRRLFAAKGCAACHIHASVGGESVNVGPVLTGRRYAPEFLHELLENPSILAKTGIWRMPDLGLTDDEIAALTSFLTAPGAPASSALAR